MPRTRRTRAPSSKPPTQKQLVARDKFKVYAKCRQNYMLSHKILENGERGKAPPKGWKPSQAEYDIAYDELKSEGKLQYI